MTAPDTVACRVCGRQTPWITDDGQCAAKDCAPLSGERATTPPTIDNVLVLLEDAMHACCDQPLSVDSMTLTRTWRAVLEFYSAASEARVASLTALEQMRADGWCYQIAETTPGEVVCWFFRGGIAKGRIPGMTPPDAPITPYHRGVGATLDEAVAAARSFLPESPDV